MDFPHDSSSRRVWLQHLAERRMEILGRSQQLGRDERGHETRPGVRAHRLGDDLFANCLLALNAETGKLVWYFQGVRHDLWDRDFPAAPALITVSRSGRQVDAIAQITKSGYVFVFDRENGKPLFPIEYRKTPPSDVDGEKAAAMQPFPLLPPPFARQEFTPAVVTDRTPAAHEA